MKLEEQIKLKEQELSKLREVKEAQDSTLFNRVRKVVFNSNVFDYHNQKPESIHFEDSNERTVIIRFDKRFSTWDLVHQLIQDFNIYNIYSDDSCMTFVITDKTTGVGS